MWPDEPCKHFTIRCTFCNEDITSRLFDAEVNYRVIKNQLGNLQEELDRVNAENKYLLHQIQFLENKPLDIGMTPVAIKVDNPKKLS